MTSEELGEVLLEEALVKGARREWLRNIAIAPVVLLVRLPFALVFVSLGRICEAAEWVGGFLPGFRIDYIRALRRHRKRRSASKRIAA